MEEESSSSCYHERREATILKGLEASHNRQSNPTPKSTESNSINAHLELETKSDSTFSHHLTYLRSIVGSLENTRRHSLRSLLTRWVTTHEISRVAGLTESQIQAWIDRGCIENLA